LISLPLTIARIPDKGLRRFDRGMDVDVFDFHSV
jgi:hypothetical protein